MEYKIVSEVSNSGLEKVVNSLIAQGYHPVGGPYVFLTDDFNFVKFNNEHNLRYGVVCQAMIKED